MSAVRGLPRDIAAEAVMLGCALQASDAVEARYVLGLLPSAGFYSEGHRLIHDVLQKQAETGLHWGTYELCAWAHESSMAERMGGMTYLTELADRAVTRYEAERLAPVLRDLWRRRQLIEYADRVREVAGDTAVPVDTVEAAVSEVPASPLASVGGRWQTAMDVAAAFEARLERAASEGRGLAGEAIPSGVRALDDVVRLQRGQVCVVAGRPGMGKSVLALQWAVAAAQRCLQVAYVSMEMPAHQLFDRFAASRGLYLSRWADRPPTRAERAGMRDVLDEWRSLGILVDDRGGETVERLTASVRDHHRRQAIDLLVVDHLGLLSLSGKSRYEGITHASGRLLALAHELGCAVVVLSQLSRAHAGRSDGRPKLSDLRDSGAVEQDANVVIGVYRPSADDPEGRVVGADEMHVMKNREGIAPTVVRCRFDGRSQVFREYEEIPYDD